MNEAIEKLKEGKVGVVPTDTIYGIVASALEKDAVEKIYTLKNRDQGKPPVILIDSMDDLQKFGVQLDANELEFLNEYWPGKVSVVLDTPGEEFSYLHRGKYSLPFRMPLWREITDVIKAVGPLATSSANIQNEKPATNIEEAKKYFGDNVDFYIDGGDMESEPSTIVRIKAGRVELLRLGAVKLNEDESR